MKQPKKRVLKDGSKAAGMTSGGGLVGLILLLPEGSFWRSALTVAAPFITVAVTSSWHVVTDYVARRVADAQIASERRRLESLVETIKGDATASDEAKNEAAKALQALTLLQLEISKRRVSAIVDQS
jgi:hypothetical protein